MFENIIARQLSKPCGVLAGFTGRAMNKVNFVMNLEAVRLLDVQTESDVLEIGFGGGVALELISENRECGSLCGTEISKDMIKKWKRKFKKRFPDQRVSLVFSGVQSLCFNSNKFDRVLSVNTIYFWPDLDQGLREIYRVLKPEGKLVLGFRTKRVMENLSFTKKGFKHFSLEQVSDSLYRAGYRSVSHRSGRDTHMDFVTICGYKL